MAKLNSLLSLRLKSKKNDASKMHELAKRTSSGDLSSFSGVFQVTTLSDIEKEKIKNILIDFSQDSDRSLEEDIQKLSVITSEVKAITSQAVILHGERIKKAQEVLKEYQEGAFTAWLLSAYGNRQTPYNFMQYYEFYTSMPLHLRPKIDNMPRQAVYTLAARSGEKEKKEKIIDDYKGEPKQELLSIIREIFPLDQLDKRNPKVASQVISGLKRLYKLTSHAHFKPTDKEKRLIEDFTAKIKNSL